MKLRFSDRIANVPAGHWNALFPAGSPFVQHEFLAALEASGSVSPAGGWQARHLLLETTAGDLIGAAPCYEKHHSYGEFVFDFSWAEAASRLGVDYYPKTLCAIPFTPSSSTRLGARSAEARLRLASALRECAEARGHSSAHCLFADTADAEALQRHGFWCREDVQFHFSNPGYRHFDDYLAALSSAKRKKIKRERRRVADAGIRFEVVAGDALDDADWSRIYALYSRTYLVRGQPPYLTQHFWQLYGQAPGTPVRVVLARHGSEVDARIVACALCVEGTDTLYGRHWGAEADYHSLHFETCYYQGIAYCIDRGLRCFDAGTQGGHKLHRGFEPVRTRSLHWLAEPRLHAAVGNFLARERAAVAEHHTLLTTHTAYRQTNAATAARAR